MSQDIIRKAFETRLATWAEANGLEVAWENVEFKPVDGEAYVRASLIPAPTKHLYLDQTGRDYLGIFQVNLYMPVGTGPRIVDNLITSLDSTFPGSFEQDSIRVTLLTPMGSASAFPVPGRFVVPVSAEYRVVT